MHAAEDRARPGCLRGRGRWRSCRPRQQPVSRADDMAFVCESGHRGRLRARALLDLALGRSSGNLELELHQELHDVLLLVTGQACHGFDVISAQASGSPRSPPVAPVATRVVALVFRRDRPSTSARTPSANRATHDGSLARVRRSRAVGELAEPGDESAKLRRSCLRRSGCRSPAPARALLDAQLESPVHLDGEVVELMTGRLRRAFSTRHFGVVPLDRWIQRKEPRVDAADGRARARRP